MSLTLEGLHTRLLRLEEEILTLRQAIGDRAVSETPAARGAKLRAKARQNKAEIPDVGTVVDRVPPDKLREMMAADGIKAEDNLFSRGIAEMRNE